MCVIFINPRYPGGCIVRMIINGGPTHANVTRCLLYGRACRAHQSEAAPIIARATKAETIILRCIFTKKRAECTSSTGG